MKTITFKLVYNWTKYAPNKKHFYRYDSASKRAENFVKLTFTKSSSYSYETILARLKTELGLNINPAYILWFDGKHYQHLGKDGLPYAR